MIIFWRIDVSFNVIQYTNKQTESIPLPHLIEWVEGVSNIDFKLRKMKKIDNTIDHVVDMFINNIIFRPVELQNLSWYDLIWHGVIHHGMMCCDML